MACAHCAGVERNQADDEFIHLPKRGGQQRTPAYRAVNPMGLVPALALEDGTVLTQSIASMEYLYETHPEPPLLPEDPETRARVRAFALSITCEIHSARFVAPSLDRGGTERARNHHAEHRAVPVQCCDRPRQFETRQLQRPTRYALEIPKLQRDYDGRWQGLRRRFTGGQHDRCNAR